MRGKVSGRAIVALPSISQQQWHNKEFNKLPSNPPILFHDRLHRNSGQTIIGGIEKPGTAPNFVISSPVNPQLSIPHTPHLIELIKNTACVFKGSQLNREQWQLLLAVIGGNPIFKPRPRRFFFNQQQPAPPTNLISSPLANYTTRAAVLATLQQQFSQLDLQQ